MAALPGKEHPAAIGATLIFFGSKPFRFLP